MQCLKQFLGIDANKFPKESCLNKSIYIKKRQKRLYKNIKFLTNLFWRFECKNNIIID